MWCKHSVITKNSSCCWRHRSPLMFAVFTYLWLTCVLCLIMKYLFWQFRFLLLCRVATPSGSCWRLPRRQCQRTNGRGPRWSWRPQRVFVCCLKTRPMLFWRRWAATFSLSALRQFGTNTTRPAKERDEKPLSAYKCHWKKRQQVCPFGGYHVAKKQLLWGCVE